ncbi:unnamed protein product [Chilo suppressalis]|uniref:Uncharacterized protein n=1 Tax=Chilo suppressalis TaxID=168631 RepID=A0ABN8AXZ6_CHISP|nr:unnamed protein product [Chilo suppressalis]
MSDIRVLVLNVLKQYVVYSSLRLDHSNWTAIQVRCDMILKDIIQLYKVYITIYKQNATVSHKRYLQLILIVRCLSILHFYVTK